MEARTHAFEDIVSDPEGFNVHGEIVEILEVGSEDARPACDNPRRFFGTDVGKPGALPIHHKG
jgi:hypothetical protein